MKGKILSIALAVGMLMAILPIAMATDGTRDPVGMSVMGFEAEDLHGNAVDSSVIGEYEITFMNLWATWCQPCVAEMPDIQAMYEEYEPIGLNVLGLLWISGDSTPETALELCEAEGITYSTLIPDDILMELINNSSSAIPVSYIIDKEGIVLDFYVGPLYDDQLIAFIEPYFSRPEPEAISIAPETATVEENRMIQLSIEYEPAYALPVPAEWTSSDESVAIVNNGGLVTGIAPGEVTITAELPNGLTSSATVEVTASSADEPELPYYLRSEEVKDGKTYLIIADYNGEYYMMTNEEAVNGRLRVVGERVQAEDMYYTEDGQIAILEAGENVQWRFTQNEDDPNGFDVMNIGDGQFLSTVRNANVYRLGLKSRSSVYWTFEDGLLGASEGGYTDDRRWVSYYADEAIDRSANFDLLNSDHEDFADIMIYELITDAVEFELGDVNMDGNVDTGDASMVLRYAVSILTLTDEQLELADYNGDGDVNTGDASGILRYAVGV